MLSLLPNQITNGTREATHRRIQLAQRMARGCRSFRHLRIAAFLKAGTLRRGSFGRAHWKQRRGKIDHGEPPRDCNMSYSAVHILISREAG
ncbi:transposase [Methylacidimicrobium sp. B4]|uniref:transposase n=1 Tax=Methylacidimicrobium sp. B4 TaxID=2796139 RepID=UPI001A8F266D|nr:transposase [Methylacidimicrobium sp. B4]